MKFLSLAEAVRRYSFDGTQYASGAALPIGSDAIVFGRELLRQNRTGLHAVFHCNSQQLNLLAAAGAVSKAECGFSGLEVFGFANGLRRAVESGRLQLEDYFNLSMALRFLGGALNWPFVPATVNIGSDLQDRSAFAPQDYPSRTKIPTVTDPFSGRAIGAFRPLTPDLAAIHVTLADPLGNCIMLGTEWSRFELSRAAKRVVVVADAIVHTDCMRQYPNLVRIPDVVVDAVVHWPFAAWPQSSPGLYDLDEAHMKLMNEAPATDEGTAAYIRDYVESYRNVECNRISSNATSFTSALDALGCLVASGRCDVGIIGAAQVDKFGNVNTTGIWDGDIGEAYRPPRTRLTGAGGANDIACGAKRYLIMVAHERKRFAERVSYVSSPGYLDGGDARARHGFVGGGPAAVITTLGVLRPNPATKEFELDGWFPFSSVEEIKANTGWDLKLSAQAHVIAAPSEAELSALRKVDKTGALRRR